MDEQLKRIFDFEIQKLFGGKITMGIMEAVREQILDKGIKQGVKKGIKQGIEKGRHEEALEIARNLKNKSIPLEIIAEATGLSIEVLKTL